MRFVPVVDTLKLGVTTEKIPAIPPSTKYTCHEDSNAFRMVMQGVEQFLDEHNRPPTKVTLGLKRYQEYCAAYWNALNSQNWLLRVPQYYLAWRGDVIPIPVTWETGLNDTIVVLCAESCSANEHIEESEPPS